MANIWNGADPTGAADATDYEMGTIIACHEAVSLTGIRVWSPADAVDRTDRKGHVWDMDENIVATIDMPTSMPSGWSTHTLDTPISLDPGDIRMIAYETNGNYGSIANAFSSDPHVSTDSAMSMPKAVAVNGNGRFITSPGSFPNTSFQDTFYGVDAVYTVASGTAPTVTGVSLSADGLDVTAVISATDPDGLSGATYTIDWGDGNTDSGSSATLTHTYTAGGLYPILASVTDSSGLAGNRAGAIEVADNSTGLAAAELIDRLSSHAAASGYFDRVGKHEPKSAPGKGIHAAIWVDRITPSEAASGLAATSLVFVLNVRCQVDMLREPQDDIDSDLADATTALMDAYTGDFSLGGNARNLDLFGRHGGGSLSSRAGYLTQDSVLYRVMVITVPIIVNDVWNQNA